MNRIVLMAAVLMAFVLTSCEKENVAEMTVNNGVNEANYVLLQKGYVNEDGFVGDLYYNENNPNDRGFIIYEQQPQTSRALEKPKWTGTLTPVYQYVDGRPVIITYVCDENKAATNCYNSTDSNGKVTFTTSVVFNKK